MSQRNEISLVTVEPGLIENNQYIHKSKFSKQKAVEEMLSTAFSKSFLKL